MYGRTIPRSRRTASPVTMLPRNYPEDLMLRLMLIGLSYAFLSPLAFCTFSDAQSHPPLRVGIVGLVHGHVHGFLEHYRHSPEIEIVGVAEPDRQLLSAAGSKYGFDQTLLFTDLEEMIAKARPQAVLVYTSTFDHRRVLEICARHGVHVVMEKPLA